jgi:hypothetical protein
MPSSSDQTRVGRTLTLGGGAESSLEGTGIELSVSPKDIRTSPYDLCANRSDRRQSREGDRWFESGSLHRRVSLTSAQLALRMAEELKPREPVYVRLKGRDGRRRRRANRPEGRPLLRPSTPRAGSDHRR